MAKDGTTKSPARCAGCRSRGRAGARNIPLGSLGTNIAMEHGPEIKIMIFHSYVCQRVLGYMRLKYMKLR